MEPVTKERQVKEKPGFEHYRKPDRIGRRPHTTPCTDKVTAPVWLVLQVKKRHIRVVYIWRSWSTWHYSSPTGLSPWTNSRPRSTSGITSLVGVRGFRRTSWAWQSEFPTSPLSPPEKAQRGNRPPHFSNDPSLVPSRPIPPSGCTSSSFPGRRRSQPGWAESQGAAEIRQWVRPCRWFPDSWTSASTRRPDPRPSPPWRRDPCFPRQPGPFH